MRRRSRAVSWLLVWLLMSMAVAWAQPSSAPPANYQKTQAVTDAGATVTIDYDGGGTADPADTLCITNDGPNVVAYDFDGTATYHATNRAALHPGETLCFSRVSKGQKFTVIGLDCNTGETASVRVTAMP